MKSILMGLVVAMTAGVAAYAGEPVVEPSSGGTGGLVLLALVGVVIATGGGMFASRNTNSLDIEAEDADDNAGF